MRWKSEILEKAVGKLDGCAYCRIVTKFTLYPRPAAIVISAGDFNAYSQCSANHLRLKVLDF